MIYEVHPADPEIWNERKWWVVEKYKKDDPMPRFLTRFFTKEEAQGVANSMTKKSKTGEHDGRIDKGVPK